jgi:hypothetical protein
MSKDYAQIANDVVTGVGLLRQDAPDTVKALGSLSTAAGARDRYRGARMSRSSATGSIDNSPGGIFLH